MSDEEDEGYVYLSAMELAGKTRPHPGNPYDVAVEFVDEWNAGPGRRSWRGDFYRYAGSHWVQENTEDVMRDINRELGASHYMKVDKKGVERPVKWSPNNASLANVKTQLFFHSAMHSEFEPESGGRYVFCANGRYDLITGVLEKHDRDIFNLHASPFEYRPGEQCPEFDRLLKETFQGDDVAIQRHLMWMAVELIKAVDLQKMYVLTGQPGSGKGTLMKVGTALIGASQVGGLSLDQVADNFKLHPLIGKSVCRINDVRDVGKAAVPAVQRLLSIVGGDQVMIDRKGIDPWVGVLPVLFTMESNETVRFPDSSAAIMRRVVTNRTSGTRVDHMDPGLADRIIATEMSGVLNRVLEWTDAVYGVWPETEASLEAAEDMRRAAQPLRVWFEDSRVMVGELLTVSRDDLYADYVAWAHANGVRVPMDKGWFVRNLRALRPEVPKPVRRGQEQEWTILGVGLPVE